MPIVGISFAVAALAVTGVPPFNGFFSKFSIFAGGFEAAQDRSLAAGDRGHCDPGDASEVLHGYSGALAHRCRESHRARSTAASDIAPSMKFVLVTLACLALVSGFFALSWLS